MTATGSSSAANGQVSNPDPALFEDCCASCCNAASPGALKNLAVCGCLQTIIAYMDGVVPCLSQLLGEYWGQSIVHEELHGMVSGNSRSRTASAVSRGVPLSDCLHRLIDPADAGAVEKGGMGL